MPPRKRTASAPKTDPEEIAEPVAEDGNGHPADEAPSAEPQDSDDPGTDGSTEPGPDGDTKTTPERSDIQRGSEPCSDCFPGGWAAKADIVSALGCEHGTWQRDPAN